MCGWSLSRLYRLLGIIDLPKVVTRFSLVFLGSLASDRLFFLDFTRTWRISYISLSGLCFLCLLEVDHRLTLATVAVPTALVLKDRLLASGGMNLLVGIFFAAKWASDEFHYLKMRIFAQCESEAVLDRNEEWLIDIVVSAYQVACWYLVPRADWVWSAIMKFLDAHESRWLYAVVAFGGIGVWSISGYLMRWLKGFYPRLYTQLLYYLQERPLCYIHSVRKFVRNHFDRLLFNVFFGKSPSYRYRPVERVKSEIRLLKLHAASSWDIVKADLISVPISEAPHFEAISYRWTSGNEVPILLDGQRFVLAGEVHELLRTLRFQLEDRLLWLDSICIDQKNIDEKRWQIGFMKEIYSTSKQVIGWIAVMREVPLLPGPFSSLAELSALNDSADEFFQFFLHGELNTKLRASVISLCNEFFFRTWIIQEVALAQKLILKFGPEETAWKDFFDAVKSFIVFHAVHGSAANFRPIIHTRMFETVEKIRVMEQFRCARQKNPDGLPLSELLVGSVDFEATDLRDKVFGLLGLSTHEARTAIPINYSTDATDITVSINAVGFTLMEESSFLLLELGGIGYLPCNVVKMLDGPSWIMRWKFVQTSHIKSLALLCNKLYKTATWAPVVVIGGGDHISSVLHIQGVYIDEIRLLSPVWWSLDHINKGNYTTIQQIYCLYSELLDAVEDAFLMVQHANHPIYNEIDRRNLVWRTICHESGKGLNSDDPSFDEDGKEVVKAIRDIQQQLRALLDQGSKSANAFEGLRLTSRQTALSHLLPMLGTRLCITRSGYFGIVPPYAKEGDHIWAFFGAPNPFVLRPSSIPAEAPEIKMHQLVGVCYVDGIMHGELESAVLEPTVVNLV